MSDRPTVRQYIGISLFWFALSLFWGAMLGMVIPARVKEVFGTENKDLILAIVLSVGACVATATQILFGALSDRSRHPMGKRRPYLIVGTLLTTVALFAFPYARDVVTLIGVYIGIQFFLNIANGPYQALIPDSIPFAYHGTASAYMGICTLLGRIGGPLAAAMLLPQGETGLFWLMVLFAVILNLFMILNVVLVKETPNREESPGVKTLLKSAFVVPLRPYPSLIWLLISRFGIMMGVYTVTFFLLYYIEDTLGFRQGGGDVYKMFMILATITGIIGTIPAGRISDRYSKKTVLYFSNAICTTAGIVFIFANSLPLAYVAVAFFGAGFGAFSAVDWALACNLLPKKNPAKYLGVWGVADTAPQIIAPIIAGPIAYFVNHQMGHGAGYRVLMGLAMVYFVVGTAALRFIKERTAADAEAEATVQTPIGAGAVNP